MNKRTITVNFKSSKVDLGLVKMPPNPKPLKMKMSQFKKKFFDDGEFSKCLDNVIGTFNYQGTNLIWADLDTKNQIISRVETLFNDCPIYCNNEVKIAAERNEYEDWGDLANYVGNQLANTIFAVTLSERTAKVKIGHLYLGIRKMKGWPWGDNE